MQYAIFEGNMERLEKRLNHIANKCKAFGCDFHYQQVGETFKTLTDENGKEYTSRFVLVEAEGTAIMNNWEFVASVEHTEKGNIFSGVRNIEIPEKYYTSDPICEHCNSNRYRKYTYIVRNKKTGEFKQVGKSCLKDFTRGLSAEMVANYMSLFDTLIQGEAPDPGCRIERYLEKEEYLAYAAETIRHFGYIKSGGEERSTAIRAIDYYDASRGNAVTAGYLEILLKEMREVNFNPDSPETRQLVKDALAWIEEQREYSNYIHNLKTACALNYVSYKNFGLLASLFPAYTRDKERCEKTRAESTSEWKGQKDEKLEVRIQSVTCVTSWESTWGTTRIYKIVDIDGNVYTWKTQKTISDNAEGAIIVGIVKDHTEFRGVKQTELTRCYVVR